MNLIKKIKLDTPAKVAQWTMFTSLIALVLPEAIENLPMMVNNDLREWLRWSSKIVVAISSFYNLTGGKKEIV